MPASTSWHSAVCPRERPTLVCGGAGCGKTLLAATFIVKGAVEYGEPGVLMTFEENIADLVKNIASLGYDLERLVADKKVAIDYVHLERSEIEETGEYDLEGLFIRLGYAIASIGAKRVALDTIESLFGGLSNEAVLRAELRRLFCRERARDACHEVTAPAAPGASPALPALLLDPVLQFPVLKAEMAGIIVAVVFGHRTTRASITFAYRAENLQLHPARPAGLTALGRARSACALVQAPDTCPIPRPS